MSNQDLKPTELQLSMEVAVIPELMPLVRDSPYELWPALGVTSQHEKSRSHPFLGERIEYERRRVRIRSVIESQRHDFSIAWDSSQCRAKERAVAVERAVYGSADD